MLNKPNPHHLAQILHALSKAPDNHTHQYHHGSTITESLSTEEIKKRTPKLSNSERAALIEILRFNQLIYETDGNYVRKYKPLAANPPEGRISWKWGISENGHTYLMAYDL